MTTLDLMNDTLSICNALMALFLDEEDSDNNFQKIGLLTVMIQNLELKLEQEFFNA